MGLGIILAMGFLAIDFNRATARRRGPHIWPTARHMNPHITHTGRWQAVDHDVWGTLHDRAHATVRACGASMRVGRDFADVSDS